MDPRLLPPEPGSPVPWEALRRFAWVDALSRCPQDPIHHAEGDVGIHTRWVLHELLAMPAFAALPQEDRTAVWLGCLLHDVGKPATTEVQPDGRITSRGHSRTGDRMARRLLWELGVPFALREQVCGLVRYHQLPFFLIDREDAQRMVSELSLSCRADLLALVAEADMRGRTCEDARKTLDNIALFSEWCEELGCARGPWPFPSDHTRVSYFRSRSRSPELLAHDDTRAEMVMLSGLPGSGKDTWVQQNLPDLPMVSLDAIRRELGVAPDDDQGTVQQVGKERIRERLRRGEPFVYMATNLDRQRRGPLLDLAADYRFRVRIVYVEVPIDTLFSQNRARQAAVPERVIRKMTDRWEVPNLTEAHRVDLVVRS